MSMSKITSFAVAFALASVVFTGSASAATVTNIKFTDNNQVATEGISNSTKNVELRISVPALEVVEIVQLDVIGDSLAPMTPVTVGGELGLQEGIHTVILPVTLSPNTGYYPLEVRTAGIFGGQRAISIIDGVTSVQSFPNAIRVVAAPVVSTPTTPATTSEAAPTWLSALIAHSDAQFASILALIKASYGSTGSTTPSDNNSKCTQLNNLLANASYGEMNSSGVKTLQRFLISNDFRIGYGVTGNYLTQTDGAVSAARTEFCK